MRGGGPAGSHARAGRHWAVARRVVASVWRDGFIHAGNLAYMAILALFPFFVVISALFTLVGEGRQRAASVDAFLAALPPVVAQVLDPVGRAVIDARHGWLLWAGGLISLWTVSSLIETLRDILRRAYGITPARAFWLYRLISTGMIMGAVVMLLVSLYAQVVMSTAEELVRSRLDGLGWLWGHVSLSRMATTLALFGSIYVLFLGLTPGAYRRRRYPKWPGALLVTLWWALVSEGLPVLLRLSFKYDLTYGSLAGVMITLFFFWLVGLGMVTGAELNAALAATPERRSSLGRTPDADEDAGPPNEDKVVDE